MRSAQTILEELAIGPQEGLSTDKVEESRLRFGMNRLTPLPRIALWRKFLVKFDEPIIQILLFASLLSMLVDLVHPASNNPSHANPLLAAVALCFVLAASCLLWLLRLSQWFSTLLLISALALSAATQLLPPHHLSVEALAIMVALFLATGVAFVSEYKSDCEFELLNRQREAVLAKVMRQGMITTIPIEQIVVGDLLPLEMGDEVAADGRLLEANGLGVDQSLMTGESEPVHKRVQPLDWAQAGSDQPGCLYRGTQVIEGAGLMLVAAVGDATAIGQIAQRLSEETLLEPVKGASEEEARVQKRLSLSRVETPLQEKLRQLASSISKVGYVAALAIFFAQLVRGLFIGDLFWPGSHLAFQADLLQLFSVLLGYFMMMVIIIVVAVPEGLPMSVTISLALAMRKIAKSQALVRQLVACETIGSATVICSDKTGTLTQNQMRIQAISSGAKLLRRGHSDWLLPKGGGSLGLEELASPIDWIAFQGGVNSTAVLQKKGEAIVPLGNSTEGALLKWLHESHIDYETVRKHYPPLYRLHFSSKTKRMVTLISTGSGKLLLLLKGAPELLLDSSTHYLDEQGHPQPLTDAIRERFQLQLKEMAADAMRTLAFAHRTVDPTFSLPTSATLSHDELAAFAEELEEQLIFDGIIAIQDPLREEVPEAIAECRQAGIQVKMITGDTPETARAIGYAIGLIDSRNERINEKGGAISTSSRLQQLSDEELSSELVRMRIIARAQPLDKWRLVDLLQKRGEVVAVTGDGTNDAPALKKADVGLAMGCCGTEVAKEASEIVLLDDSFATIVKAVRWGRSLYENIQKFLQFQLTINVSALMITFLGILLFNIKAPFTILQLLWINVIMDTFASLALCSEPPRAGIMRMKPKRRDEPIVTPMIRRNILTTAAFFVVVMLSLLVAMKKGFLAGSGPIVQPPFTARQVTLFFTVYIFFQVWNQINCRSLYPDASGFKGILANRIFLLIASFVAVGQFFIVQFGGSLFQVEPLSFLEWVAILLLTSTVLLFAEATRWLFRYLDRPAKPKESP